MDRERWRYGEREWIEREWTYREGYRERWIKRKNE